MQDRLLRIEEVSEWTGVAEGTLRFWRTKAGGGQGPHSAKLGRRIVYRERDVQEWIDRQFAGSGPDSAA